MLDMGFRPALDRIVALCPADRQTLFFSATLDGEAGKAARRYTNDAVFHEHGPSERRASLDVEHRFVEVTHESRIDSLLEHLGGKRDLTLVFVRTKHGADKLVKKLSSARASPRSRCTATRPSASANARSRSSRPSRSTRSSRPTSPPAASTSAASRTWSTSTRRTTPRPMCTASAAPVAPAPPASAITLVSPDQRREIAQMAGELGIEHGSAQRPQRSAPAGSSAGPSTRRGGRNAPASTAARGADARSSHGSAHGGGKSGASGWAQRQARRGQRQRPR